MDNRTSSAQSKHIEIQGNPIDKAASAEAPFCFGNRITFYISSKTNLNPTTPPTTT
jgi:hypothetical protein